MRGCCDDLEFPFSVFSLTLARWKYFCEMGLRWEGRERAQISGSKQKVDWAGLLEGGGVCDPQRSSAQPRRMKKGGRSSGSWAEAGKESNIVFRRVTNNKDDAFLARVWMRRGDYIGIVGWEGSRSIGVCVSRPDHVHVFCGCSTEYVCTVE